jgi:hypothetical protein
MTWVYARLSCCELCRVLDGKPAPQRVVAERNVYPHSAPKCKNKS